MANRPNLRKFVLGGRGMKCASIGAPNFAPVKWDKYFDHEDNISIGGNKYHYFTKGTSGPVLITIHGGGYSGLSWALFAEEVTTKMKCRILSLDLRGHGNTYTINDEDLSLEVLANDVANVANTVYDKENPPIILIGHSLGGAVAVEAAQFIENLAAVCVIDVVEGTALESLSSMQSILRGRPSTFKSIGHAIQWGYRGGSTHNLDAARVSMPGQIKCLLTGKIASQLVYETSDAELDSLNCVQNGARPKPQMASNAIREDAEDETEKPSEFPAIPRPPLPPSNTSIKKPESTDAKFGWRIDLAKTESFWSGWFKGLSDKFLSIREPKILLLANIHGLDTRLTVGQMQGRFQMQVLPKSGHAIHEDQPGKVADIVSSFLVRQQLAEPEAGYVSTVPGC